jgi:hypothetical protein
MRAAWYSGNDSGESMAAATRPANVKDLAALKRIPVVFPAPLSPSGA